LRNANQKGGFIMERVRTDLAAEARSEYMERYAEECRGEIDGISYSERERDGISVSEIEVLNEAGESAVGRPIGKYVTIALPDLTVADADGFYKACRVCADELKGICKDVAKDAKSLLLCGIGNEQMTPDAVGPQALKHVLVTRTLKEREPEIFGEGGFFDICAIAPGVSAQTGLDAADVLLAASKIARPDIIIVVDALAARNQNRLCRTVQISTAGISPGSGVGCAAKTIDRGTMGIPVVCVGVPTVIDARTLAYDISGTDKGDYSGLFVCPKDIDAQICKISRLLGFSVNLAFHKSYPFREMFL
jgi:spore protease